MFKSIQQFEESGIKKLEEIIENFMKDPKDMASFVYGVRDEVIALGLDIIKETLEDCNQMLRDSGKRKQSWEVVRTDRKTLTTCLGTVCFEKTLFRNKQTRESAYLLDRIMGIESHERLTEDAQAKLLEEAAQTSYRKAGEETSLTDQVSKQTVKNKLHNLTFPQQREEKRIEESGAYILSNWTAAKIRLKDRETVKGCSAEGHVSHVLSSRMSSRPMGWSRTGVDKMAHLRAYYWNGGNMLELVRQQEGELPAAAGAEKGVLSCESMLRWERQHHNKLGKYIESISHSVSTEVKKYAWFHAHIWGL